MFASLLEIAPLLVSWWALLALSLLIWRCGPAFLFGTSSASIAAASSSFDIATVLVLGDIGRSPRMQYHVLSLAEMAGKTVHVVAYGGSACLSSLAQHPRVHFHYLPAELPLSKTSRLLWFWGAFLKISRQIAALIYILLWAIPRGKQYLLLQNPPSIPTLLVAHFIRLCRPTRLVIDWHNFGYSILALSRPASHPVVRISYWYERLLGRGSYASLCVTQAMQFFLRDAWGVKARVLYHP